MDLETAKRAIDYVVKRSGPRKNIEIDLFGGEPTLIMDTIKDIIKYARDNEKKWNKNIRFTMTTNATLLDDEIIKIFSNLPKFTLSFTFLSREDVDNTNIISKIITETNINYFITAVIS